MNRITWANNLYKIFMILKLDYKEKLKNISIPLSREYERNWLQEIVSDNAHHVRQLQPEF